MIQSNKTYADAFARIVQAKIGSQVDATDDYLLSLQAMLRGWADDIGHVLAERMKRYAPNGHPGEFPCKHGTYDPCAACDAEAAS